jgi:hypothetical protein
LGEVLGIGIVDDALGSIAECKLDFAKECFIGGGDQPPDNLQDGIGRSGLNASRQFLGFGFLLG